MFNNSFLKKLNILFIESNKEDREHFSDILHKFFNKVIVCQTGEEGLNCILEKRKDFFIDIIICNKTLDDINGIEILKELRKIDTEVPFILTNETIAVDDLIIAIKYKVADYLQKPVNGKDLIFSIERVCHNKYHERLKALMQQDLEDLKTVVNEVALVVKTDLTGNINFVNDYFCQVSGYTREELLVQNYSILNDENSNSLIYSKLLEKVKSGIIWEGKLKNISKNKEEYYIYLTVLPIECKINLEIKEFMWISFLTTNEEIEGKEFKKKVAKNMYENRRINNEAREKIDELMNKISEYSNMKSTLINEKQRTSKFNSQINFYEKELIIIEEKVKETSERASVKIKQVLSMEKNVREKKEKVVSLLSDLSMQLDNKNKAIKELTKELSAQLVLIKKLITSIDAIEETLGIKKS